MHESRTIVTLCLMILILGSFWTESLTAQAVAPDDALQQRISDALKGKNGLYPITATRYVPVMFSRGLGEWSSPRGTIIIDDLPFSLFPLNDQTIDFYPLDLLTLESVHVSPYPTLELGVPSPGGMIRLTTQSIPDSFVVAGRLFAGSETGDPVLQKYTRDQLLSYNKNKIGVSAAATVSNRLPAIAYRFNVGIFGYFSTGYDESDPIIGKYDPPRLGRQNRNYLGSLELESTSWKGRTISLFAGVQGIVGWEMVPALSTFNFYEGHINTIRFALKDIIDNFSLALRRDGTTMTGKEHYETSGGKFSKAEYVATPTFDLSLTSTTDIRLLGELKAHILTPVVNSSSLEPQFFGERVTESEYAIAILADQKISSEFSSSLRARFDRSTRSGNGVSAEVALVYRGMSGHAASIHLSTIAVLPAITESFVSFSTVRYRPALARSDTFRVSGSPALDHERIHSFDISYEHSAENLNVGLSAFVQRVYRPIGQRTENAVRSKVPGDVVADRFYDNLDNRTASGIYAVIRAMVTRRLTLSAAYTYTDSRNSPTVARHRLGIDGVLFIGASTSFRAGLAGVSKTRWPAYTVLPQNDDFSGAGLDGVVPEYWTVDLAATHTFVGFWGMSDPRLRVEVTNILDRSVRYLPIGNVLGTAAVLYLSASF